MSSDISLTAFMLQGCSYSQGEAAVDDFSCKNTKARYTSWYFKPLTFWNHCWKLFMLCYSSFSISWCFHALVWIPSLWYHWYQCSKLSFQIDWKHVGPPRLASEDKCSLEPWGKGSRCALGKLGSCRAMIAAGKLHVKAPGTNIHMCPGLEGG